MGEGQAELTGPDLADGVSVAGLDDGEMLLGHAHGEAVLLVRRGEEFFAVGAACAHYGVSLAGGIVEGWQVRCPAHHAAFDVRTGQAVRAPALNPISCWSVERSGDVVRITGKREPAPKPAPPVPGRGAVRMPERVLILGAGAAGCAAAQMLRREAFAGAVTLIGADDAAPYDRPNLSKDYLAGTAPEEWLPLLPDEWYVDNGVELVLGARAARLDPGAREVRLLNGRSYGYDALLLATGSEPVRLPVPTHRLDHVFYLRTLADARAILARLSKTKRAVVVGASFIGLEATAALRAQGVEVDVVAHSAEPMEQVLGPELGAFFRRLHEEHGVRFHLRDTVAAVGEGSVTLKSGATLAADLVLVGIGVRPGVGLASWAGLALEKGGVAVDDRLRASAPGVYAAGDVCAWPDPRTGERIRSEHWVVAERQGQAAARNLLGADEAFDAVPFFWTQSYDVTLRYVGHAERWDRIDVSGRPEDGDFAAAFVTGGRALAVATIGRERTALRAEAALERLDWRALAGLAAGEVQHA
ncbi:MAG TPA: FAD-dependent oxidoreductase [Longimicrobium sp.]|nr:FAD-dependent oxidoreductase [Longimicrobium sp.]